MIDQDYFFHISETKQFKEAISKAEDFVLQAFRACNTPCLNLSAGKDSVAMLAIVDTVAKRINRQYTIWSHVSDASFPETENIINECAVITKRRTILDRSPVSAFDLISQKRYEQQFGKKGVFFDAIRKNVSENNFDLCFVGVRADESKRRLKACRVHGHLFETKVPCKQLISYPLIWMKTDFVFAAIISNNYPLHPIYNMKHEKGYSKIRLGYVTAKDLTHMGTVVFLKRNYPEIFNKLSSAYPIIRTYV